MSKSQWIANQDLNKIYVNNIEVPKDNSWQEEFLNSISEMYDKSVQAVFLPKDVEMKIIDANLKLNETTYTSYSRGEPMNKTKIDETKQPNPLPAELPAGVTLKMLGPANDPYNLSQRIAAATKQHKVDLDRKVKLKYPDTQDYSSWKKIE